VDLREVDILAFEEGASRYTELNATLTQVWGGLLADPDALQRAATILGVPPAALLEKPAPLAFAPRKAGLTGAEIALVAGSWLVTEVLLGAAKDLLKDALKAKGRQLWDELLEPAMRRTFARRDALGARKPQAEDNAGTR